MNEIRDIVHLRQMRQVEEVEEVEEYEEMDDLQLVWQPVVYDMRADHMVVLNLAEFQHRFNQPVVYTLVTMLNGLHFPTNRGRPLSVSRSSLCAVWSSGSRGPSASTRICTTRCLLKSRSRPQLPG